MRAVLVEIHLNKSEICDKMEQPFPIVKYPQIHTESSGGFAKWKAL